MSIHVTISPTGKLTALHHDALKLHELGQLKSRRISNIEFDEQTQCWEVSEPGTSQILFRHPERSACLTWEQHYFGKKITKLANNKIQENRPT